MEKKRDGEFYRFILVTHRSGMALKDYVCTLEKWVGAGITSVQLREKEKEKEKELWELGERLKERLDRLGVGLIVNDNVELAKHLGAMGVHVGASDMAPSDARRIVGPEAIVGFSVACKEDLDIAHTQGASYVGAGAVFPSSSKPEAASIGLEGLRTITHSTHLPVVAIGGITPLTVQGVMDAGADGIAVIQAVHDAADPCDVIRTLRRHVDEALKRS